MSSTPSLKDMFPLTRSHTTAVSPAEALALLRSDLVQMKEAFVEHLPQLEQRSILFNSLDALLAVLSSVPEVISAEAKVDTATASGDDALEKMRLLIRIGQLVLVVAVFALAIIVPSVTTLLTAVLVMMLALAETAYSYFDPFKELRSKFVWLPTWVRELMERYGKVRNWLPAILGNRSTSREPKIRAKADLQIDEPKLRTAVRSALGHLDDALASAGPAPPPPAADTTILALLQNLVGSTISGDESDLQQTLKLEVAQLRRQVGIEISSEWTLEAPREHWEVRESPTVTSPKVVLPAVWQKDRVMQGVVYIPASKERQL